MDDAPLHKTDTLKLLLQAYYDHLNTPRRHSHQRRSHSGILLPQ